MTGSVCDEAGEDESNEDMACSEETSPLLVPSQSELSKLIFAFAEGR